MDLAIAATANVHKVPLLTENVGDFQIIRAWSSRRTVRTPVDL
jgi:predicted nucleic acid-binding protein